jgi:hypothetical protein
VSTPEHAARRHHDDRVAMTAAIPPLSDHHDPGFVAQSQRPPLLAIAEPVAYQPDLASFRPARSPAARTPPRSRFVDRWWSCNPALDVPRTLNDSWMALVPWHVARSTMGSGARTPSPSPFLLQQARRLCSSLDRGIYHHQP